MEHNPSSWSSQEHLLELRKAGLPTDSTEPSPCDPAEMCLGPGWCSIAHELLARWAVAPAPVRGPAPTVRGEVSVP